MDTMHVFFVDDQVGRRMDALEAEGQLLIRLLLWGDHGHHLATMDSGVSIALS